MATARKRKTDILLQTKPTLHAPQTQFQGSYFKHLARHKYVRLVVMLMLIVIGIVISVQLLYPRDVGLPFANINGTSLAFKSHDEMAKVTTDSFAASKLKLTIGTDKTVEYSLKSAGAEANTEAMIDELSDYPLWRRLIPGSLVWPFRTVTKADVYYNTQQLKVFSEARSKDLSFPPQNAHLTIEDGRLKATNARRGSQISSEQLANVITHTTVLLGQITTIDIPAKRMAADRSEKDLAKVRGEAEAALAHTITIKAEGKEFQPNKNELASWILLSTDNKGDVTLSVDKEKIKAYIGSLNDQVGTPAGQTNITIVDGREAGRTTGAPGRAIDADALADQLIGRLLAPPQTIEVTAGFKDVQPSVIFNSKYTTTQAGLQAYIDDVARSKNMRISIQQLDGEKWSANARANESIPSGSTFKLFVALVLFDKMDKGEIHWEDPILDTNVAGCFERMTVASTNPCAEKWIAEFGRQYINDFIYARGFSNGTTFVTSDAVRTTAADLTKFMIGLNDGTLIGGAHRDRLLDSLGRHPYRYGIPTGSKGIVHDKVGFLWDYVHDTAIVQHPRGTYVMTIMTKGQSYAAIAATTRDIERIMYP